MRQFPAYTLTSLLAEDVELIRLLSAHPAGR
jgi:hypothetical protein